MIIEEMQSKVAQITSPAESSSVIIGSSQKQPEVKSPAQAVVKAPKFKVEIFKEDKKDAAKPDKASKADAKADLSESELEDDIKAQRGQNRANYDKWHKNDSRSYYKGLIPAKKKVDKEPPQIVDGKLEQQAIEALRSEDKLKE